MGLDVFAASHLRHLGRIPSEKERDRLEAALNAKKRDWDDAYFSVHPNIPAFRSRLGGMKAGLYTFTTTSRRHGFRAGSYSGYGRWRELLCRFALDADAEDVWIDPQDFRGRPFVELINFSDCEGCFGGAVAAKLAADFTSHAVRAKRYAATLDDPDGWSGDEWLENFRDFARAFRLAAKGGALRFC